MDADIHRLVAAFHQSTCSCVLVTTGGGSSAAGWLLAVPGASRTILETSTPYFEESLCRFLGRRPDGFCTAKTSVDMAEAAWARAMALHAAGRCVGLGCTASLATDRPKRGEHRFFASVAVEDTVRTASLILEKDARSRAIEEEIVSRVILNLMAEAAGIQERLVLSLRPGETLQQETSDRGMPIAPFLRAEFPRFCVQPDGKLVRDSPLPAVLLPGSFNPLHEAHCELLRLATEQLHLPGAFELSIANVDKPPLGLAEIRRRLGQFHGRACVWLTHAPTFVEKSPLFPGTVFVVGVDTAPRLLLPRYYEGGDAGLERAGAELRKNGCRFLVAARAGPDGQLLGLEDLQVPASFQGLLEGIPKSAFHNLISSTELRNRSCAPAPSD